MKTIRQNTLLDLVNKKTKPTISTDKDIAFVKDVLPVVDEKEDLGIYDNNLILNGEAFQLLQIQDRCLEKTINYMYSRRIQVTIKEVIKYRKFELEKDLDKINKTLKETEELKLKTEGALMILSQLEKEL
jgi:hypothetical protein